MKNRKRNKREVWRMFMRFDHGKPFFVWPLAEVREYVSYGCDIRMVEIREAPKPAKECAHMYPPTQGVPRCVHCGKEIGP